MKITKEEFQRIGENAPLELFHQGIKAKETREKYTRTLRHVLCKIFEDIFDGDFEERVNQFVKIAKVSGITAVTIRNRFYEIQKKINAEYMKSQ